MNPEERIVVGHDIMASPSNKLISAPYLTSQDVNPDERIVVGHDIMASPPEALIKLIAN